MVDKIKIVAFKVPFDADNGFFNSVKKRIESERNLRNSRFGYLVCDIENADQVVSFLESNFRKEQALNLKIYSGTLENTQNSITTLISVVRVLEKTNTSFAYLFLDLKKALNLRSALAFHGFQRNEEETIYSPRYVLATELSREDVTRILTTSSDIT